MPRIPLLIVALFFMCGGIAHFAFLEAFTKAMPGYIPFHKALVVISGVFEILGAIGLLIPKTRLFSACGLILLCIAVFPANMNMAINSHLYDGVSPVLMYLRLPFQVVIIWFIWWSVAIERNEQGWFSAESPLMKDLTHADLEKACTDFANKFQGVLQWRWDNRFNVVLSEFTINDEADILTGLQYYFGYYWDPSTVCSAPDSIRAIVNQLDGLKPGQLLMATDPEKEVFLYCVLWPWECGSRVSVRLSTYYTTDNNELKAQQINQLKQWFGLDQQAEETSGWVKVEQVIAK